MNEKNEETWTVTTGAQQVEVAVLAGGCFGGEPVSIETSHAVFSWGRKIMNTSPKPMAPRGEHK